MKKLLFLSLFLFSSLFAVQAVYETGYETVSEITLNVTTVEQVITLSEAVDAVEIYPQASGVADIWFDAKNALNKVKVWKPVGNAVTFTNNAVKGTGTYFYIRNLCFKKDSGSAVVGIVLLRKSSIIR